MRGTPPGGASVERSWDAPSASSARCPPTSSGSCVPGPRCCGAPSPACASWNGTRVALPPARSPSTWNCLRRPRPEPAVTGGTAGASWPVWVDLGTGLVSPSGSGIREAGLSSSAQRDAARPPPPGPRDARSVMARWRRGKAPGAAGGGRGGSGGGRWESYRGWRSPPPLPPPAAPLHVPPQVKCTVFGLLAGSAGHWGHAYAAVQEPGRMAPAHRAFFPHGTLPGEAGHGSRPGAARLAVQPGVLAQ